MRPRKILTIILCTIFLLHPLTAMGATGVYDFSDEAQEEFNRTNGAYLPDNQVQFQIPTETTKKTKKVKQKKSKTPAQTVQQNIPGQNAFAPLESEPELTLQSGIVYVQAGAVIDAQLNSDISSETTSNNDLISAQLTSIP